jgi:hypothetical protein
MHDDLKQIWDTYTTIEESSTGVCDHDLKIIARANGIECDDIDPSSTANIKITPNSEDWDYIERKYKAAYYRVFRRKSDSSPDAVLPKNSKEQRPKLPTGNPAENGLAGVKNIADYEDWRAEMARHNF